MKFIASRLSEGNKIFPAEIYIEENGIKVKIPGFLSGDTKFIDYQNISAVDINTPMIGFSSLTFFYQGNQAYAHGFKKEEAQQIKQAIDRGKAKGRITTINNNYQIPNPVTQPLQKQPSTERINEPQSYLATPSPVNTVPTSPSKGLNYMYSEQLETLIEFALADGELTDKEKQVLCKKAHAEGIDLDEFEMVLEARLFQKIKLDKSSISDPILQSVNQTVPPNSNKFGDLKKCPSCGASAQSYSTKCADCGHDFSGIAANSSAKKLFDLLNEIESKRKDNNDNPLKAIGSRMAKIYGGVNNIDNQKKELISNFPVPNTKEDIIEFLSLALPRAKKLGNFFTSQRPEHELHNEFAPIWKAKCQQVIMKAHFLMKEDKKTLDEINFYANQLDAN